MYNCAMKHITNLFIGIRAHSKNTYIGISDEHDNGSLQSDSVWLELSMGYKKISGFSEEKQNWLSFF
jgi:hypothetical protein